MKKHWIALVSVSFSLAIIVPTFAEANSGDFNGGVAIGSSYAGVDAAPTNGMIVQGNVGIGSTSPVVTLDLSQKADALALPVGTTGQRPTGTDGELRYNSTNAALEAYVNGAWTTVATGSSGGGGFTSQNVVTGSRALNTVYQNTTGKTEFITFCGGLSSGSVDYSAVTDSSSSPSTVVATTTFNTAVASNCFSFMVLSGNYDEVTATGSPSGSFSWTEWY